MILLSYTPRLSAPGTDNAYYYANNPFYQSGYGMPNCTCYAWGRFYEIMGSKPKLSLGDAENWWGYADGYQRGQTPKLGAVICWRRGAVGDDSDGAGHVAIVEQINDDGSIVTSNSAWNSTNFYLQTLQPGSNYTWNDNYTFQGFIYNPAVSDSGGYEVPEPISANRYLSESEMKQNALYIYDKLSRKGWTLNAIAGMLGNMETESTINPGIWQNLDAGNTSLGYGLVQWTPATKYIDWCNERGLEPSDMDSALARIEWELENGEQYYETDAYPLSFAEFKKSTEDAYYLAMAFLLNYERPQNQNQPARGEQAEDWYAYLLEVTGGQIPDEPDNPDNPPYYPGTPRKRKSMGLLLMLLASKRG